MIFVLFHNKVTHDHGSCLESFEWLDVVVRGIGNILPNFVIVDWIPREPNHGINDVIFFFHIFKTKLENKF